MIICPVGDELFQPDGQTGGRADGRTGGRADGRTEGRTDMTKLIVTFHNFSNAPKNSMLCSHSEFACFVRVSEQTVDISAHNIN